MAESKNCSSLMIVSAREMDDGWETKQCEYHPTFIRGEPFVCIGSSSSTNRRVMRILDDQRPLGLHLTAIIPNTDATKLL